MGISKQKQPVGLETPFVNEIDMKDRKTSDRKAFPISLHVGFSLIRNCMKRLAQKVFVFISIFCQKPAHLFISSIEGNLFVSFFFQLVWRHDNENVWVSPMWPGFDSQTCGRVSVDCLFYLISEAFSPGSLVSSLFEKQYSTFQFGAFFPLTFPNLKGLSN